MANVRTNYLLLDGINKYMYSRTGYFTVCMEVQQGSIVPSNWNSIYDITCFVGEISMFHYKNIHDVRPPIRVTTVAQAQTILAGLTEQ